MASDILSAALLGQLGQVGQRQDPRRSLAARLMAGKPPPAPITNSGAGLAYALSEGLEGFTGARMMRDAEDRTDARQQAIIDQLAGRDRDLNAEADSFWGRGASPPAAPAMAPPAAPQAAPAMPPVAPRGEAPAAVTAGIAARGALDPNDPNYPQQIMAINNGVVQQTMPGMPPQPVAPAPQAAPGGMQLPPLAQIIEGTNHTNPRVRERAQTLLRLHQSQEQRNAQQPLRVETAEGVFLRHSDGRMERVGSPSRASTTVNVEGAPQVGAIPPGFQLERDGGTFRMAPIPGGPADRTAQRENRADAARTQQTERQGNLVVQEVDRVLGLMDNSWFPVTGAGGALLSRVPGTAAADVSKLLDTVRAEGAFGRLQQMREASPTGGALGAVTERELALLQATLGSLEQSQSSQQFRDNLNRVRNIYLDIIHGAGNGPPRVPLSFERNQQQAPAPQTVPPQAGQPRTLRYNPATGRLE